MVASPRESAPADRARLLENEVEQLAVEAKRLGMSLAEVTAALAGHWERLESPTLSPTVSKGERKRK